MAGRVEGRLRVADEAVRRMVEAALAALAAGHPLVLPSAAEEAAAPRQLRDQRLQPGIVDMAAVVGAELGQHAARPTRPVADQRAGRGIEEDVAQLVALARVVEPADEEPGGGPVPGARRP